MLLEASGSLPRSWAGFLLPSVDRKETAVSMEAAPSVWSVVWCTQMCERPGKPTAAGAVAGEVTK